MPITSKPSEASLPRGKYVYYFGNGQADGTGAMRALLGGKGANLAEMTRIATIDQGGVGKLMEMARDLGHKTRPNIKLGVCGEHGGEPESVKFCHRLGLDYVSCSPFRVPIARLAAAQAALSDGK
jgi:phosphoenolpyruvate synthase/pyruvate phosphate dikinase